MQESRTYNIFTSTTVTATVVSSQLVNGIETGYVVLPRPAIAATAILDVTAASGGAVKVVIQRGIINSSGSNGAVTSGTTIQWFDYAAFSSTTTAGQRIMPLVYTSTVSDTNVTTNGSMPQNSQLGGSIGTRFRGVANVASGATITFSLPVEFEF